MDTPRWERPQWVEGEAATADGTNPREQLGGSSGPVFVRRHAVSVYVTLPSATAAVKGATPPTGRRDERRGRERGYIPGMADDLHDFDKSSFTHEGTTKDIYRIGAGPAVIVLAEIPGITPKVAGFARRVAALGCTAVMPQLFGTPGAEPGMKAMAGAARGCISKEFAAFATGRTAPVTTWLRALAEHEHERCGGPGVGAVGMCFTGGFALGMAVHPSVLAPVMSQPSLPIGFTKKARGDLHLAPGDLTALKARVADADDDLCVIGLRFHGDRAVPPERFASLRRELGDAFVGVELPKAKGSALPNAHSVLTEDLIDEPGEPTRDALEQVLQLFRDRLLVDTPSA
jgi:dienelactone hydrolase